MTVYFLFGLEDLNLEMPAIGEDVLAMLIRPQQGRKALKVLGRQKGQPSIVLHKKGVSDYLFY